MSNNMFNQFTILNDSDLSPGDPIFNNDQSFIPSGFVVSVENGNTNCVLFSPHFTTESHDGVYLFSDELLENEQVEELFDEVLLIASEESKNFWNEFNNSILETLEHDHDIHNP